MAQCVDVNSDPLLGWRVRCIQYMEQAKFDLERARVATQVNMLDDPGATTIALAAGMGSFRAYRLQAGTLVDVATLKKTAHYDFFTGNRE